MYRFIVNCALFISLTLPTLGTEQNAEKSSLLNANTKQFGVSNPEVIGQSEVVEDTVLAKHYPCLSITKWYSMEVCKCAAFNCCCFLPVLCNLTIGCPIIAYHSCLDCVTGSRENRDREHGYLCFITGICFDCNSHFFSKEERDKYIEADSFM